LVQHFKGLSWFDPCQIMYLGLEPFTRFLRQTYRFLLKVYPPQAWFTRRLFYPPRVGLSAGCVADWRAILGKLKER